MTSGKDREKEHYNKMITKKKNMKQYIHYFWTGPIKKISLKNFAKISFVIFLAL